MGSALAELMPDEPEALGLLALMLLHDARRAAACATASSCCCATRTGRSGTRRRSTRAGACSIARSRSQGRGPYVSRRRRGAPPDDPVDWAQIAALYGELFRLTESPVVELNRAVAVAEADGPLAGLEIIDLLELDNYHYCTPPGPSCSAASNGGGGGIAYIRALELAHAEHERRFLERKLATL